MKISFSKGRTVNLGNFESERIDLGLELECEPGQEDATYERARAWVERKVIELVKSARPMNLPER